MANHGQTFCFPLRILENDKVRLDIFDPSIHADPFVRGCLPHPSIWSYIPLGPFPNTQSFMDELYSPYVTRSTGTACVFAILDKLSTKARPPLAGIIGLLNTSVQHLKAEVGFLIILPKFHRTHVTSNACGLLAHWALDLPEDGGLGLRRLQWQTNSLNVTSRRVAERLGFVVEGVIRWDHILPPEDPQARARIDDADFVRHNNGVAERKGDPRAGCAGRDSLMLAICWDDWEGGVREKVDEVMRRTR